MGTCPEEWDNSWKRLLNPHKLAQARKTLVPWEGPAAYQVVGEVTAHQADDG